MKNNVYKIPWPRLTKLWNRVVIIFKINPPEYMAPHSNVMLPVGWYVKPHKELNDHLIIYDDTDDEIGLIWMDYWHGFTIFNKVKLNKIIDTQLKIK